MKLKPSLFAALIAGVAFGSAQAQTKWDMPTPYPDSNFHTKNVKQFAEDVKTASGGKLDIVVHSNASLIKAPEIKRAVQTGQVNIGQILVSSMANENSIFAFDSNPFLAPNYPAAKKLLRVCTPHVPMSKIDWTRRASNCCSPCPGRRRASTPRSRSIPPPTSRA